MGERARVGEGAEGGAIARANGTRGGERGGVEIFVDRPPARRGESAGGRAPGLELCVFTSSWFRLKIFSRRTETSHALPLPSQYSLPCLLMKPRNAGECWCEAKASSTRGPNAATSSAADATEAPIAHASRATRAIRTIVFDIIA